MLTIFVMPLKATAHTHDHPHLRIYPLAVEANKRLKLLGSVTEFRGIDEVELVALRWFFGARRFPLPATEAMRKGIVEFLLRYHAKEDMTFDCYSFACLVNDVQERRMQDGKEAVRSSWERVSRPFWHRVGTTILLVDAEKVFKHAAVYLGRGLWISVYGAGGELNVSTLADMKRDFKGHQVLYVVPR